MVFSFYLKLSLVLIQFYNTFSNETNPYIIVDLSSTGPKDIYIQNTTLSNGTTNILLLGLNNAYTFLILQIHTYIETVTLSYSPNITHSQYTNGTNIGLYWGKNMAVSGTLQAFYPNFYLIRSKPIQELLHILIVVNTYEKNDPIPGGCNLSFETNVAPYQKIKYNKDTITTSAQPPSTYIGLFPNCNSFNISTVLYFMYIDKEYHTDDTYFNTIKQMLTVENINKYGIAVPENIGYTKFQQTYSVYRGTGYMFTLVSTLNNRTSIYVPTISFGCNISNWEGDCVEFDGVLWRITYSMLMLGGLFVLFVGHTFFKTSLALSGYTFGAALVYNLCAMDDNFPLEGKLMFALVIGIFFGVALLCFYKKYNKPKLAIFIAVLISGFIISSWINIAFGILMGFKKAVSFYVCFIFTWAILVVLFSFRSPYNHISALSVIGSYIFVVSLSIFMDSHIQYSVINIFRMLSGQYLPTFMIPFNITDNILIIFWIILSLIGMNIQTRISRGKPPFPVIEAMEHISEGEKAENVPPNEITPLIINTSAH